MLRVRRLLVPRFALPGWRCATTTTATATATATAPAPAPAPARCRNRHLYSTTTSWRSDGYGDGDGAGDHHSILVTEAREQTSKAERQPRLIRRVQGNTRLFRRPVAHGSGELDAEKLEHKPYRQQRQQALLPADLAFRRIDPFSPAKHQQQNPARERLHRNSDHKARKEAEKAAIADQARAAPRNPRSAHVYRILAGLKPFGSLSKDPETSVPLRWARTVAMQLGLDVKKTKPHELKRALARRLGFTSWSSMPANDQESVLAQVPDTDELDDPNPSFVLKGTAKPAASNEQASFQAQATGSARVDESMSPSVLEDTANMVACNWAQMAARHLGIAINEETKLSALTDAIAQQLGYESWTKIPVSAQATIQARAITSPAKNFDPTRYSDLWKPLAKDRRADLEAEGTLPPFPQRDYSTGSSAAMTLEGPFLKDGFIVGKGMSSYFSQSFGQNKPHESRFRVLPAWMSEPVSLTKARDAPEYAQRTPRSPRFYTMGGLDAQPNLFRKLEGENLLPQPQLGPQELGISWRSITLPAKESAQSSSNDAAESAAPAANDSSIESDLASTNEVDEPSQPTENEPSIFNTLFPGKKDPGLTPRPQLKEKDTSYAVTVYTPRKPRQTGSSIYARLFPEAAAADPEEESEPDPTQSAPEPLDPAGDSLMVSLRNEVRHWIPEATRSEVTAPEPGQYGSHSTVVVLSGVSDSLVESDFYRIVPEGKYVEGWAGGLVKVAQARDPLTQAPLGQYFLLFHSRPSAVAYAEEVKRLHALARALHHAPGSGRTAARGSLDDAPVQPQLLTLSDKERAAARSFTLCAPGVAAPRVSVRMWTTEMVGHIASKTDITEVVQALQPETETPAKVLVTVATMPGAYSSETGLTPLEMWTTLRDDGRERGTPWVLKSLAEGIMPVKTRSLGGHNGKVLLRSEPLSFGSLNVEEVDGVEEEMLAEPGLGGGGQGKKGDAGPDPDERFDRFILTFSQPSVARRFVRSWHKRAIWDAELKRSLVLGTVALM